MLAPKIMYIDINSCFATIEQQANPMLRYRPVVVAAATGDYGCILASSTEAKKLGIKTGMRVGEAKQVFRSVVVLPPDPDKYRFIHHQLKQLLSTYTPNITPKSIDEFCLDFSSIKHHSDLISTAKEIKQRIKQDIGDYITVSIGIAPNRFLAKTAAGLHKPDGLDVITDQNIQSVFASLQLTDLCGISIGNASRLHQAGIHTATAFLNAPPFKLKAAFRSIAATYWYLRLRGLEIDDFSSTRKSFSHSYVLPHPALVPESTTPILVKLVHQLALNLRQHQYQAQSLFVSFINDQHQSWYQVKNLSHPIITASDFTQCFLRLSRSVPFAKAKKIIVACSRLQPAKLLQLDLFNQTTRDYQLTQAMDQINLRFGDCTLIPAQMLGTDSAVPDAIAFGKV